MYTASCGVEVCNDRVPLSTKLRRVECAYAAEREECIVGGCRRTRKASEKVATRRRRMKKKRKMKTRVKKGEAEERGRRRRRDGDARRH
uniref:Uncharacterized protein n=1 Tax=Hyaloperonospora arabidopsidis (strain Emoy2) TaxID=559515 RepID=M4BCY1_HYAAE